MRPISAAACGDGGWVRHGRKYFMAVLPCGLGAVQPFMNPLRSVLLRAVYEPSPEDLSIMDQGIANIRPGPFTAANSSPAMKVK